MDFVEFENSVERLTSYDFEYLRKVWSAQKSRNLRRLSNEDDIRLARILAEHPEYYSFFENRDDIDQAKKEEVFMHLAHHVVIEAQLEEKNPIEVLQFINHVKLSSKYSKGSHHEAVHLASLLFLEQVVKAERSGGDIDLKTYKSNLRKFKKRPLRKIRKRLLA
ncbi:MAG: DUF1841 family protein [Deltaproteobacteria bacterium]|nr:DUF1841 family protein [Deltaproteobacteria bacterium]